MFLGDSKTAEKLRLSLVLEQRRNWNNKQPAKVEILLEQAVDLAENHL